jgi:hypothetical protein
MCGAVFLIASLQVKLSARPKSMLRPTVRQNKKVVETCRKVPLLIVVPAEVPVFTGMRTLTEISGYLIRIRVLLFFCFMLMFQTASLVVDIERHRASRPSSQRVDNSAAPSSGFPDEATRADGRG